LLVLVYPMTQSVYKPSVVKVKSVGGVAEAFVEAQDAGRAPVPMPKLTYCIPTGVVTVTGMARLLVTVGAVIVGAPKSAGARCDHSGAPRPVTVS
jgi:hypothetical protein